MRTDYPGSESSGELPGAKVPGNFRSRERKFSVGTFAPRSENTEERKVPEPTGQCAPAGRKEATGKAVTSHSLYANSPACLRNVFPRIVHSPRIGMSAKRLVRELARPRIVVSANRLSANWHVREKSSYRCDWLGSSVILGPSGSALGPIGYLVIPIRYILLNIRMVSFQSTLLLKSYLNGEESPMIHLTA